VGRHALGKAGSQLIVSLCHGEKKSSPGEQKNQTFWKSRRGEQPFILSKRKEGTINDCLKRGGGLAASEEGPKTLTQQFPTGKAQKSLPVRNGKKGAMEKGGFGKKVVSALREKLQRNALARSRGGGQRVG